jgi:hypothetical protein
MRGIVGFMFLFGTLVLLASAGCDKPSDKKGTGSAQGGDVLVLEYEEIDLIPGTEKPVKVKSGKADTAEAPKDSGVTAKVEGDKVTVAAGKDAKEGTHEVKVKGGQAKDATIKVKVKKDTASK